MRCNTKLCNELRTISLFVIVVLETHCLCYNIPLLNAQFHIAHGKLACIYYILQKIYLHLTKTISLSFQSSISFNTFNYNIYLQYRKRQQSEIKNIKRCRTSTFNFIIYFLHFLFHHQFQQKCFVFLHDTFHRHSRNFNLQFYNCYVR